MGVEETHWILLGTAFHCRGVPPDAEAGLAALLAGFERCSSPPPGLETVEIQPEVPLVSHFEHRMVDTAIQRAMDHHVLHAGAVASPAGTCLIVGESGAGKTSLTLWLWANGLRLVTDDLCPVAHGTLTPEAFPRALHMDAEYSPRLLARIPPRPSGYPADYYPFLGRAGEALPPVTRLLVLERGPRPEGEVEPLPQSEAAHHLLRAVIRTPSFAFDQALGDMLRLAAGATAHRLRAATPEGAGDRACELLGLA